MLSALDEQAGLGDLLQKQDFIACVHVQAWTDLVVNKYVHVCIITHPNIINGISLCVLNH